MEILDIFLSWDVLIVAVTTSLIVSAIRTVKPEWKSTILIFWVSLVVTLLNTTFIQGTIAEYQKVLGSMLINMAFAILFYAYLGTYFVDKLFAWVKGKIDDKLKPNG